MERGIERFTVRRILGGGDLWITEFVLSYDGVASYAVSIMEFREGQVAAETRHFACEQSGRFWREADINRQVEPAGLVANDPQQTWTIALTSFRRRGVSDADTPVLDMGSGAVFTIARTG